MTKDVIIVGGGLAGLINAIQLAQAGLGVSLIEKQAYPFHRVCGEYISNETLPFLQSLGIDPFDWGAVALHQFRLTSPQGSYLERPLGLGGFGISRYTLDNFLAQKAQSLGVEILTQTQVIEIQNIDNQPFRKIVKTEQTSRQAQVVIGAYGKRANLDNFLQRSFFRQRSPYMGVKYHIRLPKLDLLPHPADLIALHNFKDGYCGISRIEDDKFCLCYLTTRQNLKDQHTIENLENKVLRKNKYLNDIWQNAEFVFDKPKVINEVSFAPKPPIENGILMCGDSAGMIAPLCGNGMAMAIHSAKILSELLIRYFQNQLSADQLTREYQQNWQKQFATRLWLGRNVQKWFGNPTLTELLVLTAKNFPPLARFLINNSHGQVF
ncbi:MAG: NAD(P)/FAD-dependent oxidoreductase [Microscillaceae bacterium]|jgi:flavin-dependent dehydrogenase|nr:NAD(P)/FAD-dependent oxidoreductase [Microscillaceae bacterium]